jgi:hypothetical protein
MKTTSTTKLLAGLAVAAALGLFASRARAVLALEKDTAPEASQEMTISVRTGHDAATVVHVPELAVGESRTLRSESGSDVVVTRGEEGFTVSVNGKEYRVLTPREGLHVHTLPGEGEDVKTLVTGDGVKRVIVRNHAYAFSTEDGATNPLTAAELLEKHPLAALDGADARTKETVAKALEELVAKHLVLAPSMEVLPGADAADGDRVEIRVTKKGEK